MSTEFLRLLEPEDLARRYALVDLDSTVFNILSPLNKAVYDQYGLDMMAIAARERRPYWFPEWPEIRAIPGAAAFVCRLFRKPEIFREAEVLPGAPEVLDRWRERRWVVGVGTRRFDLPEIRRATYFSLEENRLGWLWQNIFWGVPKSQLAKLWLADIAVDDYEPDLEGSALIKIRFGNYFWQEPEPVPGILKAKDWLAADRIVRSLVMSHNI